jgi:hypothetical protein
VEPNAGNKLIGGKSCADSVPPDLMNGGAHKLTVREYDILWELFQQIGACWHNVDRDSINLRSSWLEFIAAKTEFEPSYVGEYANAVKVLEELIEVHGSPEAFKLLFFKSGIPEGKPTTRLAHAKVFVVNEFIHVQIVAGGFLGFGGENRGRNYNGFIRGSRYNRVPQVRNYVPARE